MIAMLHYCVGCGQEFKLKRGKQRFCNKACWYKHGGSGKTHPRYKGGSVRKDGYLVLCINGKPKLAHRHIMEQHLGRPLASTEVVHHVDGNPRNNSIANLMILPSQSNHAAMSTEMYRDDQNKQCSGCREIKPRTEFSLSYHPTWDRNHSLCKACQQYKRGLRRRVASAATS
jgi:hypothetical protein